MREFTQAEGQLFIYEDQKGKFSHFASVAGENLPFWTEAGQKEGQEPVNISLKDAMSQGLVGSEAYAYVLHIAHKLFYSMGIPDDRLRLRQHHSDEKAFYAKDAWDLEVKTESFGWIECCGIHDRGSYDLEQHEKFSKTELKARDEEHEKQTPHIIEIAFGTDRPVFALMDIAYSSKEDNGDRDLLKLPKALAPVKVSVFPLVNKLHEDALKIYYDIKDHVLCTYDKSGSVGRRYARADEVGTPYCVTVDFDTREGKGVTVRDRDTMEQIRVPLEKLGGIMADLVAGRISFNEALTLWNEQADQINVGDKVHITNGYVGEYQGKLQLSTGKFGALEVVKGDGTTSKVEPKVEPKPEDFEAGKGEAVIDDSISEEETNSSL